MEFVSPNYLSEAFDLLDTRGKEFKICGGMTHVLRFYPHFPAELPPKFKGILHLGNLTALSECREEAGRYVIGSTSTIANLAADPYVARYAPAVTEAAMATSTPQIRNRRTVGGELGWGSYHSPLIASLLALDAKVRLRFRGESKSAGSIPEINAGSEETLDLKDFYADKLERKTSSGEEVICRKTKSNSQEMILKIILPEALLQRSGMFSFFRALTPKISTENSGVVVAVSGVVQNGVIQSARFVASGLWMWTLSERLPLEGVKMSDAHIFEKLYSFCDRYSFDSYRREGPSPNQLGLIVFGLLKEGFSGLLGR
ncbi:MAG: FAD binding domain-containing protein [Deltaproteobacteria bacterium]|nr:FAD binding domain-containing protein [Deltaproteobacteria bacterium]